MCCQLKIALYCQQDTIRSLAGLFEAFAFLRGGTPQHTQGQKASQIFAARSDRFNVKYKTANYQRKTFNLRKANSMPSNISDLAVHDQTQDERHHKPIIMPSSNWHSMSTMTNDRIEALALMEIHSLWDRSEIVCAPERKRCLQQSTHGWSDDVRACLCNRGSCQTKAAFCRHCAKLKRL